MTNASYKKHRVVLDSLIQEALAWDRKDIAKLQSIMDRFEKLPVYMQRDGLEETRYYFNHLHNMLGTWKAFLKTQDEFCEEMPKRIERKKQFFANVKQQIIEESYKKGKVIEYRPAIRFENEDYEWKVMHGEEALLNGTFDWDHVEYRVQPTVK